MLIQDDPAPETKPDEGRAFFTSAIDGDRYWILTGPFATFGEAKGAVDPARDKACKMNDRAWWFAFGVCQAPSDSQILFNDR
jgi:hypothetical protein